MVIIMKEYIVKEGRLYDKDRPYFFSGEIKAKIERYSQKYDADLIYFPNNRGIIVSGKEKVYEPLEDGCRVYV